MTQCIYNSVSNVDVNSADIASERPLTCSECNQNFKKMSSLRAHSKMHIDGKPFQCIICGRCFSQNSNLKKHLNSHKVWPSGAKRSLPSSDLNACALYVCSFCMISFDKYNELRSHLKIHKAEKVYKCVQKHCTETFTSIEYLLNHIDNIHTVLEYNCDSCKLTFHSLEEIAQHYQTQNGICNNPKSMARLECTFCGMQFRKADSLSRHLADTDHSYICSICQSTFLNERSLRRHLIVHKEIKDYHCIKCGLSFRTKQNLHLHALKHSDSNFTCIICNSNFKRKDILKRHQKIHQPNKKVPCPFELKGCEMKFTRSDKLKMHIKTHLNKGNVSDRNLYTHSASSTMELIIVPIKH